jgi:hypothetical protein
LFDPHRYGSYSPEPGAWGGPLGPVRGVGLWLIRSASITQAILDGRQPRDLMPEKLL